MNNLKFKAVAILLGFMGVILLGVGAVRVLAEYIGPEGVANVFVGVVLVWLLYQLYGLILAKLELDAKIDELTKDR